MKNYEMFSGDDLLCADLILKRRLQLLIHSCIYYELNKNIIPDKQWDSWAKELVNLQYEHQDISKKVDWYEAFADWDGSTGAFLPIKNEWVVNKANYIIKLQSFSKETYSVVREEKHKEKSIGGKRRLF